MSNEMSPSATAEGMNAITRAMGAVVFAMSRRLPPNERKAFADDLAAMAEQRCDAGDTTTEMLLLDLHQAAMEAVKL